MEWLLYEYLESLICLLVSCNPNWPEIKDALLSGQTAQDRPELISRVFNMKLKVIFNDFLKENIFGKVLAYLYTIEFQKRGLPHAHILLILNRSYKPKTTADYDTIISAEIPDKNRDPNTYETVVRSMIHGPCGIHKSNVKMENALKDIHEIFRKILQKMKMVILFIDEEIIVELYK